MEYMQCFTIIYTSDLTVPFATKRVLYLSAASGPDFLGPVKYYLKAAVCCSNKLLRS